MVAGCVPDRSGLLLYFRLHIQHRGARGRGALADRHPAPNPLRGLADVPARRRREPNGQGSIVMLENYLSFWIGKLLILCLLGFVATGWVVTITLSAADATAHIVENPLTPESLHGQQVVITLVLLTTLGAVFLKGFREAIGIAVFVVRAYLLLNLVVVAVGLYECVVNPANVADWQSKLFANYGSPLSMPGVSLLVFPRLTLGLRDRREHDAARARRPGRRPTASRRPHPQHAKDAYRGGSDHELLPHYDELRHGAPHTPRGVRRGRQRQRTRACLRGAPVPRRGLRHRIRPEYHHHIVVCWGLGDGGAIEHRAPLSAPLRHGSRVGTRDQASGARLYCGRLRRHHHLRRWRRCAGRGVRNWCNCDDDLSRLRGDALLLSAGLARRGARVRGGHGCVHLRPRGERDTAARRAHDLRLLRRRDHHHVARLADLPLARAQAEEDRDRRDGPALHRRGGAGGRDPHRRPQAPHGQRP